MTSDVLALDWEGFRELVEGFETETDDTYYVVIGDHTPRREWREVIGESLSIQGLPHARTVDEFVDALDEDATPSHLHDAPEPELEDGGVYFGDFGYPDYGFMDEGTTALEHADTQLVGSYLFPETAVDPMHHAVWTLDQYREHVDQLEAEYGDDRVVFVGTFAPRGTYGTLAVGGDYELGSTRFPPGAFTGDGVSPLHASNLALAGTVIVPRENVADDVLELADGERDNLAPPQGGEA